jgi:tRNA G18 (ribose-2'-O)-methylase SpoU
LGEEQRRKTSKMPGSVKSDVSSLASPPRSQRKGDSNGALSPSPKKAEGPLPPPSSYIRVEYGDRRVEVYRNLKERDVTGRGDVFILEGENSVRNLVRNGRMPLVSVCLSERRLRPMAPLIEALSQHNVPVYVLKSDAFSSIVGFNFHRGVLACGKRPRLLEPLEVAQQLPSEGHSTIILGETINNLDNVGGLFRNAAAFGCGAVLLDDKSADPLYRKACRVSGGHALNVPFSRIGGIGDVIAAAKATGHVVVALVTPSTSDRENAVDADIGPPLPLDAWRPGHRPDRVAVLVGAEGPGLTEAAQRLADVRLCIPMDGMVPCGVRNDHVDGVEADETQNTTTRAGGLGQRRDGLRHCFACFSRDARRRGARARPAPAALYDICARRRVGPRRRCFIETPPREVIFKFYAVASSSAASASSS